jgi:formylglycine-generating enzyme required for sulfatase activity
VLWWSLGGLLTAVAAFAVFWMIRTPSTPGDDTARQGNGGRPHGSGPDSGKRDGGPTHGKDGEKPRDQDRGERPSPKIVPPPRKGERFSNALDMEFAWIEPGSFLMGSPDGTQSPGSLEEGRSDNETPHPVKLTRGFHLGVHLVTQWQWEQMMGKEANRSHFIGQNDEEKKKLPVDNVSWNDCQEFCRRLSEWEGRKYRLPTEAEWEYACRAGKTTAFWWGDTINANQANYDGKVPYGPGGQMGEYRGRTTPVAAFDPNPWGLYDMHGNLWQWCQDWYGPYRTEEASDPVKLDKGAVEGRVLRGGSWCSSPKLCRAANRNMLSPARSKDDCGCRVALSLD